MDECFYQAIKDWVWDKHTKVMADRLFVIRKSFDRIASSVCVKQLLEPMRSLLTYLQRNFGFKKIEDYDKLFQSLYVEACSLANEFGIEEKWSELCGQQINWNSIPSVYLPFLDTTFVGIKPRSVKKRRHIMNYACSSSSMIKIR